MNIMERVVKKEHKAEDLAENIIKNPDLLTEILKGLSSEKPDIKFKSAKILRIISQKSPELLYPRWDFFEKLLDSENNIIKWNAMDVVANLAMVDSENKFEKIFKKFYGLINEGSLVTAAHIVDNSGKIAKAKPDLQSNITHELLKVEHISLPTEECRNILKGKTILAFNQYFNQINNKDEVISFVERQKSNTRNATKKKAEKFLKQLSSQGFET